MPLFAMCASSVHSCMPLIALDKCSYLTGDADVGMLEFTEEIS